MKSKKKMILLVMLGLLLAALLLAVWLFWPVIHSAASVEKLEDGLYTMEYPGDCGLDDFLEQGGASTDAQVTEFLLHRQPGLYQRGRSWQPGCSAPAK